LGGLSAPPALSGAPRNRPTPDPTIEIPGELIVVSLTTDATVEVDGKVIGQIPVEPFALRPGRHTVRVTKRGFAPATRDFDVAPGATVELEIDLLPVAGLLTIASTPSGASVKVDGKVL
ncbi:MAG TPA: PEGA domain-containing protein, partial [Myxococcota bacterium]|nr:PEGA domain-containing protein [Myxococcota bacterium]